MNPYQQKWIETLTNANIPHWTIKAQGDDIYVEMPHVADLKLIRDNLPATLGAIIRYRRTQATPEIHLP